MPASSVFSTQPTLRLEDIHGNGVPSTVVILSLYNDSQCLTAAGSVGLVGNTASTNGSGFASFSIFQATISGSYYVKATSIGSLATNCSLSSLNVTFGVLDSLAFTTQPGGSVAAGMTLPTQPIVSIQDAFGNGIPSVLVTLSLYTDSSCATEAGSVGQSGNTSTTDSNGLTSFSSFRATQMGVYYIKASGTGLSTNCSTNPLTVTYGTLSALSFSTQPGGSVIAGASFTTQPVLYAVDVYGNAVSSASITLTAFSNSGCSTPGTGSISNGVVSSALSGYATFTTAFYNRVQTINLKATSG